MRLLTLCRGERERERWSECEWFGGNYCGFCRLVTRIEDVEMVGFYLSPQLQYLNVLHSAFCSATDSAIGKAVKGDEIFYFILMSRSAKDCIKWKFSVVYNTNEFIILPRISTFHLSIYPLISPSTPFIHSSRFYQLFSMSILLGTRLRYCLPNDKRVEHHHAKKWAENEVGSKGSTTSSYFSPQS